MPKRLEIVALELIVVNCFKCFMDIRKNMFSLLAINFTYPVMDRLIGRCPMTL